MRWTRRDAGQKPSAAPVIEDVPFFTQGQRPLSHLPASSATSNRIEQLQKAERVLGISHRQSSLVTPSNARQRGSQPAVSAQEPTGSDRRGVQSEKEDQPMDTARSANGGLKPWPSLQSTNNHASMHDMHAPGGGRSSPAHYSSNKTSHQHQVLCQPSNSTLRSHYESSQQPTSSSGRPMGLRKARSGVASTGDDVETSGRPLKSALKHPSYEPERIERPASKKEGSWMPKFGNIFAKPQHADRGLLQPHQVARNGSLLSVVSTSPSYAVSPSFVRNAEATASPASGSGSTESSTRPKVFESDVYDSAKVHVRRPPKGIQNWFDGVDVSSDDDEQIPNEALSSTFSPYEDKSFQPVQQSSRTHNGDRRKEEHERKGHPEPPSRRSSRQPGRPGQNRPRNISDTFVEENAMAIDLARQRMQEARRQPPQIPQGRRNSGESFAPSSFSHAQSIMTGAHPRAAEYSDTKHEPDDRYGRSRVPVESIRSMSEYSEYEPQPSRHHEYMPASSHYKGHITGASPNGRRQSSNATRPSMVKRSNTRDTVMTTQTSGSIPIHWSNDDPMPALPTRARDDSEVDHTSEALRRLIGRDHSVRKRSSRAPSSRYTYEDSVGGDTNNSNPSDISRMMAVTEEEMALLEMMRLKRAAMQKGDISEGAQQVLNREHEQQRPAGNSGQDTAKADKEERSASRNGDWAYDLRPNYDQIAGLGSLMEEDADEKLRIERFLASQTPLEDVFPFPSPPPRSRESSIPHEYAQMEDLLLPRTYTPQPPEPRPQQEQEKPVARVSKAPSTISSTSEFDADESAQLEAEMRKFLGGDEFSESSAFPLPPKASISSRRASRRAPRTNGMLAPVLPSTREEETTPPIPNRSPNRMQNFNDESVLPPSDRTMHLRADSQALRPSPPTIVTKFSGRRPEPPTPSDTTSERLSAFLGPNFEHSLDLTFPPSAGTSASQSSNMRYDSPSICTSQASPLTPTFPISLASAEKNRAVEIASNENNSGYLPAYDGADNSSLRTSSSTKSGAHSHKSSKNRKSKAMTPEPLTLLTPATYNGRTPSRLSSNGSCMSASDDVLAAWAELGGVSDGLSMRSR